MREGGRGDKARQDEGTKQVREKGQNRSGKSGKQEREKGHAWPGNRDRRGQGQVG